MFKYKLSVRGYELDSYGHVNHAVYINYFEQARWEIFRGSGIADELLYNGYLLVVTEMKIRYSRELRLFDEIEVITGIKIEEPYLVFQQKMFLSGQKIKVCSATVKTIFTDMEKTIIDIPGHIIKKLEL